MNRDTAPTMFGLDPEDFYQLYQHTYKVVKSFGKGFRFGSTSLCIVFNVPKDLSETIWISPSGPTARPIFSICTFTTTISPFSIRNFQGPIR